MAIGVFVAEIIGSSSHYLEFACNVLGYGLHGAGLLPFVEINEPE